MPGDKIPTRLAGAKPFNEILAMSIACSLDHLLRQPLVAVRMSLVLATAQLWTAEAPAGSK